MENDNKFLFEQLKEYFKDAVEVESLGKSKMLISDFDFGTLEISCADVWIKGYKNNRWRILYNLVTKQYATITKSIDPNKIIFDQVKEYFKDAVECVSLFDTQFLIQDCNFDDLRIKENHVMVTRFNLHDIGLYNIKTKEYSKIVAAKTKLTVSFNPSKNWLEDAKWAGGTSITSEQLREFTEPKNEPKRLKVGGIYKGEETNTTNKVLFKVTKDDGQEIWGYGFINGKFFQKNEFWYKGGARSKALIRLQETTQEKWEKALLKYKK